MCGVHYDEGESRVYAAVYLLLLIALTGMAINLFGGVSEYSVQKILLERHMYDIQVGEVAVRDCGGYLLGRQFTARREDGRLWRGVACHGPLNEPMVKILALSSKDSQPTAQ